MDGLRRRTDHLIAVIGAPHVGKSSFLAALPAGDAFTFTYPGTVVEIGAAVIRRGEARVGLVDLPSTYGLGEASDEQWAALQGMLTAAPDAVVVLIDATNLPRTLFLFLSVTDLGFPAVAGLTMLDQAAARGVRIDEGRLARALESPVVPVMSVRGEGVRACIDAAVRVARSPRPRAARVPHAEGHASAMRVIEERHERARAIADDARRAGGDEEPSRARGQRLLTAPLSGAAVLAAVLAAVFASVYVLGGWLSRLFTAAWDSTLSPLLRDGIGAAAGDGMAARIIAWGLDGGVRAVLDVGIPYLLPFYVLLAVLEDAGYLAHAAFLTDALMRRFGLSGSAAIPLAAGAGCNVPALMGVRILPTMRERLIASALIVMVPCSARSTIILGFLAGRAGWQWGLAVFIIDGLLIACAGRGLDRLMPGRGEGLVMEMLPLRAPSPRTVWRSAWRRLRAFITAAAPLMVLGSAFLGVLYETGWIWRFAAPLAPVTEGWLGLPPEAGLALVFGVLRKELAPQFLATLAAARHGAAAESLSFMSAHQLFVYALVASLYIPCVASIAVLGRGLGWARAAAIAVFTTALAVCVGGAGRWVLTAVAGWP